MVGRHFLAILIVTLMWIIILDAIHWNPTLMVIPPDGYGPENNSVVDSRYRQQLVAEYKISARNTQEPISENREIDLFESEIWLEKMAFWRSQMYFYRYLYLLEDSCGTLCNVRLRLRREYAKKYFIVVSDEFETSEKCSTPKIVSCYECITKYKPGYVPKKIALKIYKRIGAECEVSDSTYVSTVIIVKKEN